MRRRFLAGVVLLLFVIFVGKAAYDLWHVLIWEWRGAMDPDALNYFFVSRGLLNGVQLYRDLYEAKPPGIFWLMASSLLTTGDERFLSVVQVLLFISIPFSFAAFGINECRRRTASFLRTALTVLFGLLAGALLALYLEERAGMLQTESFGAFFGSLYVLSIVWGDGVRSKRRIALSSALLFLSLWMKEPFLLSTFGAAVALAMGRRAFVRSYLIPLCIAGAAGFLLLLAFGNLGDYVTIHLSAMLTGRVASDPLDPLWLHWLSIRWLYANTIQYNSSAPLFGFLLILLLLVAPLPWKSVTRGRDVGTILAGGLAGLLFLFYSYFVLILLNAKRIGLNILAPTFVPYYLPWTLLLIATVVLFRMAHRRNHLTPMIGVLAGLCLAAQAVGISIYAVNHYAFAVPFYAALLFLGVRYMASEKANQYVVASMVLLTLIVVGTYETNERFMQALQERAGYTSSSKRATVDRLDALLTSCGFDDYYSFGVWKDFAFAKHSHVGPMVILNYVNYLPEDHFLIRQTISNILERTPVLVTGSGATSFYNDRVDPLIRERFRGAVPLCAENYLPLQGYDVLFADGAVMGE